MHASCIKVQPTLNLNELCWHKERLEILLRFHVDRAHARTFQHMVCRRIHKACMYITVHKSDDYARIKRSHKLHNNLMNTEWCNCPTYRKVACQFYNSHLIITSNRRQQARR